MGKYTRVFNTEQEYNTYINGEPYIPNMSYIRGIGKGGVRFTPIEGSHDYSQDYLTFVMLESGSISTNLSDLYCSLDGENWSTEITGLTAGDKVFVKGDESINFECYSWFNVEGRHNVEGNVMSVYDSTGFRTRTSFDGDYGLTFLFASDYDLISAENLVLPATTLTYHCYESMFYGCTSLTTPPSILPATTLADSCYSGMFSNTSLTKAPNLPATTLADSCYQYMFSNCTSLTSVPELPATTLANNCYYSMFAGCTSLTTAPELPSTTLADSCYENMFLGCRSLNYIKCLATNISATDCTLNWVSGVSATGTFVKAESMTGWTTGNNGIPTNWTVEDDIDYYNQYLTLKILSGGNVYFNVVGNPGTKEVQYSINNGQWTSITFAANASVSVVAGDRMRIKGLNNRYSTSKTAYCNFSSGASEATYDIYGNIMSLVYGDNFTGQTTLFQAYSLCSLFNRTPVCSAKHLILPATTVADCSYRAMFANSSGLTEAPEILEFTAVTSGICWYMFENCSITESPILPCSAVTVDGAYGHMFENCTGLTKVTCLATSVNTAATTGWTTGVSQTGVFVKNPNATESTFGTRGANGIPVGWTIQDAS